MKKSLIFLFITFHFIYSLNEPKNMEFDVEYDFDNITNNEFSFNYEDAMNPLIMKINPKDNIPYDIYCKYPGFSCAINWSTLEYHVFYSDVGHYNGSYYIKIKKGKGTLMIHPMNNKIKIDFTQQCYGIPNKLYFNAYDGSLKYLVTNLREKITVSFSSENLNNNPFKVCHRAECITNVSKYKFEKGEEYTIEVNTKKSILDSFSICNISQK